MKTVYDAIVETQRFANDVGKRLLEHCKEDEYKERIILSVLNDEEYQHFASWFFEEWCTSQTCLLKEYNDLINLTTLEWMINTIIDHEGFHKSVMAFVEKYRSEQREL